MKVVALGVKGIRLRFTAQEEDAEQALKAIGDTSPPVSRRAHNERVAAIT